MTDAVSTTCLAFSVTHALDINERAALNTKDRALGVQAAVARYQSGDKYVSGASSPFDSKFSLAASCPLRMRGQLAGSPAQIEPVRSTPECKVLLELGEGRILQGGLALLPPGGIIVKVKFCCLRCMPPSLLLMVCLHASLLLLFHPVGLSPCFFSIAQLLNSTDCNKYARRSLVPVNSKLPLNGESAYSRSMVRSFSRTKAGRCGIGRPAHCQDG